MTKKKSSADSANPERGQRGGFLKLTITMPAEMLTELKMLGMKRRTGGEKDTGVSELIREAVSDLLAKEQRAITPRGAS